MTAIEDMIGKWYLSGDPMMQLQAVFAMKLLPFIYIVLFFAALDYLIKGIPHMIGYLHSIRWARLLP